MLKYLAVRLGLKYSKYILITIVILIAALVLLITSFAAMLSHMLGSFLGLNQAAGYCFPVDYPYEYTDIFGMDRGDHTHTGIDLALKEGSPVYAVYGGLIEKLETDSIYGVSLLLRGNDGFSYLYAHLSRYATVKIFVDGKW